ncbi:hypothetical protein P691DRAFT_771149 [Macrolepiota fuliginosa MF-IS2]|uniref:Uncharacterized protein n=1 Tax=Macrolepiota fuliginosa MF-IS2 TaxID=1400762 RepID=A0A9P5XLZ8_9AGAR|nr:hypothetical protein P691DRAFT_771149 [Macrolepiota fuliginosa MF-IS2]
MLTSVKELVEFYESSPSKPPRRSRDAADGLMGPGGETHSSKANDPVTRPARFLRHPRGDDQEGIITKRPSRTFSPITPDSTSTTFKTSVDTLPSATVDNNTASSTFDIDGIPSSRYANQSPLQYTRFAKTKHIDQEEDEELLLHHTYPPSSICNETVGRNVHIPVPATTLFARKAAPLHLPHLDQYLSKLPKPPFAQTPTQDQSKTAMFRPMEQLEKLGKSLDDLEVNAVAAPFWRNRKTILGYVINAIIGVLGSSALAPSYSLQGVFNTVQIFALILSTIVPMSGKNLEDKWRKLFLGTIPNIIALNFASVLTQSLVFLLIFMAIAFGLLYYFYRARVHCDRYNTIEGLRQTEAEGSRWGLLVVTFLLTVIYLPMSTMAVHVLVWSQDLWVVPNPYVNATSLPPQVAPLGPSNEFKDPLDFCWTTTMKRNEVNYAPIFIILSVVILAFLTAWYPILLRRVIQQSVPKVDAFTELGRPRRNWDMDTEYQRLLSRDKNPFAFLYSAFRRGWGAYESTYLFAKLSTLVIIAVIDSDNCLFRSRSRTTIPIIRQILLLLSTISFFVAQCIFAPFLDPVNNASEWTSRLNYVTTSTTALLIALDVPGKDIIDTYVLYSIYIVTYGLSFYFSVINTGILQRLVKRLTRRVDFSIDVFSPQLDISSSSIHLKRRIWQEALSTLLFTDPETGIPQKQRMIYAQARNSEYPPYLLEFAGSLGERHAENIKILREVGTSKYARAVGLLSGPDEEWYRYLESEIQRHHVGPDCYWKDPREPSIPNCSKFFGNAWWIPFPPTLVIRYDDGRTSVIQDSLDLETYITQNTDADIQKCKHIRMSLRALEDQVVLWPYDHLKAVGQRSFWCCGRQRYAARTSVHFRYGRLRIKRRGKLSWEGIEIGSGFEVELEYTRRIKISGEAIGLTEDFDLTPALARFLEFNQDQIQLRSQAVEEKLFNYKRFHRRESRWKVRVLSYRFLTHIYDRPCRNPSNLCETEHDARVRHLLKDNTSVFSDTFSRYQSAAQSEPTAWWYIFWDDFWRRNHGTISPLSKYASDFNPHYPSSIAYTPLPRSVLEGFLAQRGLFNQKAKWNDWIHHGFLNKLYLRLNEAVFTPATGKSIMFHLGYGSKELDMNQIDIATRAGSSTLGTGGGTDHDISWIRTRPVYRWEGIMNDPLREGNEQRTWLSKFGAWLGLTPVWRGPASTSGIAIDVTLDQKGRYVLLGSASSNNKE